MGENIENIVFFFYFSFSEFTVHHVCSTCTYMNVLQIIGCSTYVKLHVYYYLLRYVGITNYQLLMVKNEKMYFYGPL